MAANKYRITRRHFFALAGASVCAATTTYAAGQNYYDDTITHFDPERTAGQKIGILFSGSRMRLNAALRLYDEQKIDTLLIVGSPRSVASSVRRARAMAHASQRDGGPVRNNRQLFFVPREKNDTAKDARDACQWLADTHNERPFEAGTNLVIITSGWHALRCNRHFREHMDTQNRHISGFRNLFTITTHAIEDDAYSTLRKFIKMRMETFYRGGIRIARAIAPNITP